MITGVTKPVIVPMEAPPYRLSGRLFGALLNHKTALAALGATVNDPPHGGTPRAPVLYVKPRNTLAADGDTVLLPDGVPELEVGATLGLVIGRPACNVSAAKALEFVAGFLIVNDVSVPHTPYYRPSIRQKARDGFCPLGPRVVPRDNLADPDRLAIRVYVDDELMLAASTADLVRPVATLLADVSEFMTLGAGDVLAVGVASPAPRVRAGQRVVVDIEGLGRLENRFADRRP